MTLIAAVVLGLALGFFLGFTHRALVAFAAVWLAVLLVQSFLVLDDADVEDATYIPIQVVIFALGIGLLWLAAGARALASRPRGVSPGNRHVRGDRTNECATAGSSRSP